tara:strand:+ start:816 stop:1097 length:282 start_codon:yes stop_codon:yes gene_type:complete
MDSTKKKLNNNLRIDKGFKEEKKEDKIINTIHNVNDIKIKKNKCNKCFLEFDDYSSLEKHKWKRHPVDNYEIFHSQIKNWNNYSLAYRDDPYY